VLSRGVKAVLLESAVLFAPAERPAGRIKRRAWIHFIVVATRTQRRKSPPRWARRPRRV